MEPHNENSRVKIPALVHFTRIGYRYISIKDYNGNKALVGRILFAKDIRENISFSGFCIRFRPNVSLINPNYLFYMLKSEFCKRQYTPSQQTNITNLSQDTLGAVQIPIINELKKKKSLVDILYFLDSKIDTNEICCFELESMAKMIYDYWFTQFDFPNAEGKPYRASGGKMVWNEQLKREIPDGWRSGCLSDIADITMGQSPEGSSYNEDGEGTVFYQGRTDYGTRFPTPRVYTTSPTRFASKGDILLSVRAPVGDLNIAMEDCCIGRGLAGLKSKLGSQLYLLYTLSHFRQFFNVMDSNGTTFGAITKDTLFELPVIISQEEQIKAFETVVSPIERKIHECEKENRELQALRDWLLPMLMNGQATVE